jgi:hypothetical protein
MTELEIDRAKRALVAALTEDDEGEAKMGLDPEECRLFAFGGEEQFMINMREYLPLTGEVLTEIWERKYADQGDQAQSYVLFDELPQAPHFNARLRLARWIVQTILDDSGGIWAADVPKWEPVIERQARSIARGMREDMRTPMGSKFIEAMFSSHQLSELVALPGGDKTEDVLHDIISNTMSAIWATEDDPVPGVGPDEDEEPSHQTLHGSGSMSDCFDDERFS